MSQITKAFCEHMLVHAKRKEHAPLTIWEEEQLALAWLRLHDLANQSPAAQGAVAWRLLDKNGEPVRWVDIWRSDIYTEEWMADPRTSNLVYTADEAEPEKAPHSRQPLSAHPTPAGERPADAGAEGEEMLRCLGFAKEMGDVKNWPVYILDADTFNLAKEKGWLETVRHDTFIPRMGQSICVMAITKAGTDEWYRLIATRGTVEAPSVSLESTAAPVQVAGTPRTDAEVFTEHWGAGHVRVEFARQLEREAYQTRMDAADDAKRLIDDKMKMFERITDLERELSRLRRDTQAGMPEEVTTRCYKCGHVVTVEIRHAK